MVAPLFVGLGLDRLLASKILGTGPGDELDLGDGTSLGIGGIDSLGLGELPPPIIITPGPGGETVSLLAGPDEVLSLDGGELPIRVRDDIVDNLTTISSGLDEGLSIGDQSDAPLPNAEPNYIVISKGTDEPNDFDDRPWLTHLREMVVTHAGDVIVFPYSGNDPERRAPGRDMFVASDPFFLRLTPLTRPAHPQNLTYRYIENLGVIRVDDPEPRVAMEELKMAPGMEVQRFYDFRDAYGPIRVARMRFATTDGLLLKRAAAGILPGGSSMILTLEMEEGSASGLFIITGVLPFIWQRYIELVRV